jgi:hypothetical protein
VLKPLRRGFAVKKLATTQKKLFTHNAPQHAITLDATMLKLMLTTIAAAEAQKKAPSYFGCLSSASTAFAFCNTSLSVDFRVCRAR